MTALSVLKSGRSAGSSAQHRFIMDVTSSSQERSAVLGLRHLVPLRTASTISKHKGIKMFVRYCS